MTTTQTKRWLGNLVKGVLLVAAGFCLAQSNQAAHADKKASTQTPFWQQQAYQGTFKSQSAAGKNKSLTNKVVVRFSKGDNRFTQQVTTSLGISGIQQQVTDGTVKRDGNKLTLTPESTATVVYKTAADQKAHKPANYHQSGSAFNSKLTFSAAGQPMNYTVNTKKKVITGAEKPALKMTQTKTTLIATKEFVDQLQK
ncbi:hypothetical protein ACRYI5_09370 [Furfurilactobacillus sp. WILCCON 0119]